MTRTLDIVHVFKQMPAARIREIERVCEWRDVGAEQEIVTHLDTSRLVGFLVAGRARSIIYAASGTVVAFGELLPGAMFGEITAIDGQPRTVGVEALEPSVVALLSHQHFLALFHAEPAFATALLTQICRNMRGLTERIFEFSTLPVNSRVQSELLRLAETKGLRRDGKIVLPDLPTHADFAARVSTHREAVTREINRLVKKGILAKSDGQISIQNIDALRELVRRAAET